MIGTVIGNYKILEKIGEGGMGAVFKGVDLMLEREVAIKALRRELASQPQIVERFRSEAVTLAKLNHPNIATLHSFFRQADDFFMIMEYVRGDTFDQIIRKQGAMPVDRAVSLFCQALEGIDHAHKLGIIHRDIKPANVMLTEFGCVKVMDFGIARVLGSARMTRQGHLVGTIEYMSPEQIRGQEADSRSDIYSLGMLLYEMLTGRIPFESQSEYELMKSQIEAAPRPPREHAPHVSLPIEEAIMRSLAKRPDSRFQTAGEFRNVLVTSMRAATNPLIAPPRGSYAAPATRISDPRTTPSTPAPSGPVKETRLPDAPVPPPAILPQTPTEVLAPSSSLRGRLTWKHFAGAAAAVLILAVVPLALIGLGDSNTEPQTPPALQASPVAAPPAEQKPVAAQPQPPATGAVVPNETEGSVGAEKPATRNRNASGTTSEAKEQGNKNEKAATNDKGDENKGGGGGKVGGFFRRARSKLGGLIKGDDKNDKNEKTEKKKP